MMITMIITAICNKADTYSRSLYQYLTHTMSLDLHGFLMEDSSILIILEIGKLRLRKLIILLKVTGLISGKARI